MLKQLKDGQVVAKSDGSFIDKDAVRQLINLCRSSLSKREIISDIILDL
jgi:hypothetical protein